MRATVCTTVFVLLCALTNFVAKTVDFVELIQGVRKRPRFGIEIYPRKCRGVVFVVVVHYFTFIFSIRGKRFSKDEPTMNLFLRV